MPPEGGIFYIQKFINYKAKLCEGSKTKTNVSRLPFLVSR
jgi:hypothetical protein